MRNDHGNDKVRSLLPTDRHSTTYEPVRYFVDTSMKLGTQSLEAILIDF